MEAARALPEGKTIAVAGTAAKQDQKKAKADLQLQVGKAAVKQVSEQTNSQGTLARAGQQQRARLQAL